MYEPSFRHNRKLTKRRVEEDSLSECENGKTYERKEQRKEGKREKEKGGIQGVKTRTEKRLLQRSPLIVELESKVLMPLKKTSV